ncbi:Oxysterol-binding protein 3 [Lecanora helva]
MAGMEQLEIHSRSYLVRYVNVKAEHTISWSIRPDKKSINFGIFKHPGAGLAPTPNLQSSTFELPPTPGLRPEDAPPEPHSSRNASSTAIEKLKNSGLKLISWHGACEANKVSMGTYNVPRGEGGTYALVFDNTFAKSFAKSATFVLLTYPTDSPPQSSHHKHHVQLGSTESSSSLKDALNARKGPLKSESSDAVLQISTSHSSQQGADAPRTKKEGAEDGDASKFFTGVLHKRRRKKHQGWARRFFSLDYTTATLSYYQSRSSRAVRGAVPLSLAAVGTNEKTRQISVDSGAEIWHLKAANQRDFLAWKDALELARTTTTPNTPAMATKFDVPSRSMSMAPRNSDEEREWRKIEEIASKLGDSRDVAKSLAKDTDPKYLRLDVLQPPAKVDSNPISTTSSTSGSPSEQSLNGGFFNGGERKPFWKRKPSSDARPMPGMYRSVSATPSTNLSINAPPTPIRTSSFVPESQPLQSHAEEGDLHDRCMKLLRDLDSITAEMGVLITESKKRRTPLRPYPTSRLSIETQGSTEEFFDAQGIRDSQLLDIHHESDEEGEDETHSVASDEDSSGSEADEVGQISRQHTYDQSTNPLFPPRPESLTPLPAERVKRRETVDPPTVSPPSLVGFFRKNVGKDLSTISMPVTSNEPISLLQRLSEVLEYSGLLDEAVTRPRSSNERLIYVAAFAIAFLSNARVKERSIRKPFNPMLGETFELVREDKGFRFISEKICHRPFRMACQAESEKWTLTQSPLPSQKFWGKSAELTTEGKFRLTLRPTGDHFSWSPATSFLRNIIAGEKYVEPVGTMTIVNEITGEKAIVTFKTKGMFSGRSEDVCVQTFDAYGDEQILGLAGRWTSSLTITEHGEPKTKDPPIWTTAGLVPDAPKRYGFTTFAASLNEITPIEREKLPPTDSRLRPDQRAAEDGDWDQAETLKLALEEAQRKRRKAMEDDGVTWLPKWFEKVEGGDGAEEVWVAKSGKESYWDERKKGKWLGVDKVFG